MKALTILIIFLSFSTISLAQSTNTASEDTQISQVFKENTAVVIKATASTKMQRKVKNLNQKKSNAIISIKAYRKSLNIKVKTVKLC